MEGHEDLVTIDEIARMARTDRATAGTWTKERGFPQPLSDTDQGPVYLRGEVEDWLRETGKRGAPPTAF